MSGISSMSKADRGHGVLPNNSPWGIFGGNGQGGSSLPYNATGAPYTGELAGHIQSINNPAMPNGGGDPGYWMGATSLSLEAFKRQVVQIKLQTLVRTVGNLYSTKNRILLEVYTGMPFDWEVDAVAIFWDSITIQPSRRVGPNMGGYVPTFSKGGKRVESCMIAKELHNEMNIQFSPEGVALMNSTLDIMTKSFSLDIFAYLSQLLMLTPDPPMTAIYPDHMPPTIISLVKDFYESFAGYNKGTLHFQNRAIAESKARAGKLGVAVPTIFLGTPRHNLIRNLGSSGTNANEIGEAKGQLMVRSEMANVMDSPNMTPGELEISKGVNGQANILEQEVHLPEFFFQAKHDYHSRAEGSYITEADDIVFFPKADTVKAIFKLYGNGTQLTPPATHLTMSNGKKTHDKASGLYFSHDGTRAVSMKYIAEIFPDNLPTSLLLEWISTKCHDECMQKNLYARFLEKKAASVLQTKLNSRLHATNVVNSTFGALLVAMANSKLTDKVATFLNSVVKHCEGIESFETDDYALRNTIGDIVDGEATLGQLQQVLNISVLSDIDLSVKDFSKDFVTNIVNMTRVVYSYYLVAAAAATRDALIGLEDEEQDATQKGHLQSSIRALITHIASKTWGATVNTTTGTQVTKTLVVYIRKQLLSRFVITVTEFEALISSYAHKLQDILAQVFHALVDVTPAATLAKVYGKNLGMYPYIESKNQVAQTTDIDNTIDNLQMGDLNATKAAEIKNQRKADLKGSGITIHNLAILYTYLATPHTVDGFLEINQQQLPLPYRDLFFILNNIYTGDTAITCPRDIGKLGMTGVALLDGNKIESFHTIKKIQMAFAATVVLENTIHRYPLSAVHNMRKFATSKFFAKTGTSKDIFNPFNMDQSTAGILPAWIGWKEDDPNGYLTPYGAFLCDNKFLNHNLIPENEKPQFAFSCLIYDNFKPGFDKIFSHMNRSRAINPKELPSTLQYELTFPLLAKHTSSYSLQPGNAPTKAYLRDGIFPKEWQAGSRDKRMGYTHGYHTNEIRIV